MEVITIRDVAKDSIVNLCKESVLLEYDMILNYPRILDHIVNFEKIKDEQLLRDIDRVGKESLGHWGNIDRIIGNLGGEMAWQLTDVLPRLVDVVNILERQIEKEKAARDIYKEAKKLVMSNKVEIKVGGFLDRFRGTCEQKFISYDQLVNDFDRLIWDEERHRKTVEDSVATYKALVSRRGTV